MMNLKDLRKQNKKTVAEIATVLGVSDRAIYNYERGLRTIGIEQIKPLAELYDVTVEEMLEYALESIKIGATD